LECNIISTKSSFLNTTAIDITPTTEKVPMTGTELFRGIISSLLGDSFANNSHNRV
jgi:hypothetical protein